MRFQILDFKVRSEIMKEADLNVLVKSLIFERPKDEVRVVVMKMKAKQVLVQLRWSNLNRDLTFVLSSNLAMDESYLCPA